MFLKNIHLKSFLTTIAKSQQHFAQNDFGSSFGIVSLDIGKHAISNFLGVNIEFSLGIFIVNLQHIHEYISWFRNPEFELKPNATFRHFQIDIGGHHIQCFNSNSNSVLTGFPSMHATCNNWCMHGRVIASKEYFWILRCVLLGKFLF